MHLFTLMSWLSRHFQTFAIPIHNLREVIDVNRRWRILQKIIIHWLSCLCPKCGSWIPFQTASLDCVYFQNLSLLADSKNTVQCLVAIVVKIYGFIFIYVTWPKCKKPVLKLANIPTKSNRPREH